MSETNLFMYCGSSMMKEKLWRDMFIAHIFGIDMPDDIEVRRLPAYIKNGLSAKEFSSSLASLLILYGGGYLDDEAFTRIFPDCEKYADLIEETERILVERGGDENEDRYNGNIIRNTLLCAVNSRKYDEMQRIDINSALALYDSSYTVIIDGFVHLKDKEYLEMLAENNIGFGMLENGTVKKLTDEDITNGIKESGFDDLKNYTAKLLKGEKHGTDIRDCIILDIRDIAYLTAVYKKPYYKEFLKAAKAEKIPYDNNFYNAYEDYVYRYKLRFTVRIIPRKRKVCGEFPNWFDYNVPDGEKAEVTEEDLSKTIKKDAEYSEDKRIEIVLSKLLRNREFVPDTVLEITNCGKVFYYIVGENKKCRRLDEEQFHRIPFDFDNIWTTIKEWSRDKKLCKKIVDGKSVIVVEPESEWEKIKPQDRKYAKRIIEEQALLMEEQRRKNKFMRKLSELREEKNDEEKAHEKETEEKKKKFKGNRKAGVEN